MRAIFMTGRNLLRHNLPNAFMEVKHHLSSVLSFTRESSHVGQFLMGKTKRTKSEICLGFPQTHRTFSYGKNAENRERNFLRIPQTRKTFSYGKTH
jgi:hypothetical protein